MFKYFVVAAILAIVAADHIDKDAQVKNLVNDISPDGQYHYGFETTNGINIQGAGSIEQATGSAKWVAPDGEAISFSYVADENGFQPTGDHILPIPDYILRALEWNKAHPEEEIITKA